MWLMLFVSMAFSKELIMWSAPYQPPFSYVRDQAEQNALERIQADLYTYLPDYQHRLVKMSFADTEKTMKEGRNLCAMGMLKTDMRQRIAYLTPLLPTPPHHVIIRKADHKFFLPKKDQTQISFKSLLEQKKMTGGFTQARSYGKELDKILARHRRALAVRYFPPTEKGSDLIALLEDGTIDFTIEYRVAANEAIHRAQLDDKLEVIPLMESREMLPVYIACTRNEWGRRAIHAIDRMIQRYVRTASYRENIKDIFPPQSYEHFKKEIDEFIKKRARESKVI